MIMFVDLEQLKIYKRVQDCHIKFKAYNRRCGGPSNADSKASKCVTVYHGSELCSTINIGIRNTL